MRMSRWQRTVGTLSRADRVVNVWRRLCVVGALKEALRRMIIRQRRTLFDPFLLKVVFPYLEAGNHRTLLGLARIWNDVVPSEQALLRQTRDWREVLSQRVGSWQHSMRALVRWLQPQAFAPITVVVGRGERRARRLPEES